MVGAAQGHNQSLLCHLVRASRHCNPLGHVAPPRVPSAAPRLGSTRLPSPRVAVLGRLLRLRRLARSTPAGVAKSRIMSQTALPDGTMPYNGTLDCWKKVVANEGPLALCKGFIPGWLRLGPWQLVFWCSYEQLRILEGDDHQARPGHQDGVGEAATAHGPRSRLVEPAPWRAHTRVCCRRQQAYDRLIFLF